ncbi:MAG TPA: helix-turn-helix transcriptional regulator [Phycisphaerales bacterium]|nr:helix-turn-helix transcriptional regulator [Phycisphaerales bacterium]
MKRVAILTSCITETIGRLPGVATTDWADRAAGLLARVLGRASASVVIASLDARGFLIQFELAGAGRSDDRWPSEGHPGIGGGVIEAEVESDNSVPDGLDELRRSFRLGEWVGWSLGPITQQTLATTTAGLAGLRRAESPVWKRWSRGAGDVGEIVAGVVAVPGARESRVVLVEIACPAAADPEQSAHDASMASAVLEAVLPLLASKVAAAFVTSDRTQWLTPREEEVLWHLLAGEKVPDIAAALGRSVYTVHDHVKSLHRKLGASNRGELVSRALGHIGPRATVRTGDAAVVVPSRSAGAGKRTRL